MYEENLIKILRRRRDARPRRCRAYCS